MSERDPENGSPHGRWSRFYREPSRRWYHALILAVAVAVVYYGLVSSPPDPQTSDPVLYRLRYLVFGAGAFLSSIAEFLPKDRITLAGRLRIAGNALFWAFIALIVLQFVIIPVRLQN